MTAPDPEPVMPRRLFFRLLAAATPAGDHVSDAELLRRFASAKDPAAFELLVRRHADAVWAAGLRVVGNRADAEDVFQSAFLVLARKAGSVRGPCVGGWLHRVAVNAALKLKASRERERPEDVAPVAHAPGSPEADEVAAIVHQELARLPDRYRLPVVLCDLEGQTHAEAAKALGWPVGSVSGRLSRARGILRDRLTRRGLAAPAVVAATAPPAAVTAAASVPSGTVSPVVLSLAEGVLSAMRIAKLQLTAAVLAAGGFVALAGLGTGYALTRVPGQVPAAPGGQPAAKADPAASGDWTPAKDKSVPSAFPDLKLPNPVGPNGKRNPNYEAEMVKLCPRTLGDQAPQVEAGDDAGRKLLKARLHQGRLELMEFWRVIAIGRFNPQDYSTYYECLTDMQTVATELWAGDPKTLIPWLEEFVLIGKETELFFRERAGIGADPPQVQHMATRHRLAAESALWKAKRRTRRSGGRGGKMTGRAGGGPMSAPNLTLPGRMV